MFNVAIDGPAGAGKSSIAKAAARSLGFIYVDTGALYRAVALAVIRNGIDVDDERAVEELLESIDVSLDFRDGTQSVILNGEDVSEEIRLPEVSAAASTVSAIPAVRTFLFNLQRHIAENSDCLMDGRDIGTVVLPNADLKVFLTASPEERAKRRYEELMEKGNDVDYEQVLSDINKRDYQDTHRKVSPLKAADDAVLLDTTSLSFDEVTDELISLVKERMAK